MLAHRGGEEGIAGEPELPEQRSTLVELVLGSDASFDEDVGVDLPRFFCLLSVGTEESGFALEPSTFALEPGDVKDLRDLFDGYGSCGAHLGHVLDGRHWGGDYHGAMLERCAEFL